MLGFRACAASTGIWDCAAACASGVQWHLAVFCRQFGSHSSEDHQEEIDSHFGVQASHGRNSSCRNAAVNTKGCFRMESTFGQKLQVFSSCDLSLVTLAFFGWDSIVTLRMDG